MWNYMESYEETIEEDIFLAMLEWEQEQKENETINLSLGES